LPKPLVAVIGDSEDLLGAIESCKERLEFIHLNAIPEEPNFWSVRTGLPNYRLTDARGASRFREGSGTLL
jgi:hypothetical protein